LDRPETCVVATLNGSEPEGFEVHGGVGGEEVGQAVSGEVVQLEGAVGRDRNGELDGVEAVEMVFGEVPDVRVGPGSEGAEGGNVGGVVGGGEVAGGGIGVLG